MHSTPIISVIVPVFNSEKYLEECVKSILDQDFTDFEVILINDGSTDGSGDLCNRLALSDLRIRVIHQQNSGVAYTRLQGIRQSKGEWIVLVDSDDIIYPNNLSCLYQTAIGGDYDIVKSGIINTKGKKWIHKETAPMDGDRFFKSILADTTFANLCSAIYRKSLFDDECYCEDASIRIGEDVWVNMLLAKRIKKAINIPDILYFYRTNPDSVMSQKIAHPEYWRRYYDYFIRKEKNPEIRTELVRIQLIRRIKAFLEPEVKYDHLLFAELKKDIFLGVQQFGFNHKYISSFQSEYYFRMIKFTKKVLSDLNDLKNFGKVKNRKILY